MPDAPQEQVTREFFALATEIRDQLEAHLGDEQVSDGFVRDEGDHFFRLDGEFNLHVLAGLITRGIRKNGAPVW